MTRLPQPDSSLWLPLRLPALARTSPTQAHWRFTSSRLNANSMAQPQPASIATVADSAATLPAPGLPGQAVAPTGSHGDTGHLHNPVPAPGSLTAAQASGSESDAVLLATLQAFEDSRRLPVATASASGSAQGHGAHLGNRDMSVPPLSVRDALSGFAPTPRIPHDTGRTPLPGIASASVGSSSCIPLQSSRPQPLPPGPGPPAPRHLQRACAARGSALLPGPASVMQVPRMSLPFTAPRVRHGDPAAATVFTEPAAAAHAPSMVERAEATGNDSPDPGRKTHHGFPASTSRKRSRHVVELEDTHNAIVGVMAKATTALQAAGFSSREAAVWMAEAGAMCLAAYWDPPLRPGS
jgi:hypothetical protein